MTKYRCSYKGASVIVEANNAREAQQKAWKPLGTYISVVIVVEPITEE
jgi:hypothetical protein